MKNCTRCKIQKEISEFQKCSRNKNGITNLCKVCINYSSKKSYNNRKESISLSRKKKRIEKHDEILAKERKKYNLIKDTQEYKEYQRVKARNWSRKNRHKRIAYHNKRKREDAVFKLRCYMTNCVSLVLKRRGFFKKSPTMNIVGCDYVSLKMHIETKFTDGMSWDNYGSWHIDHIIPLASAKTEKDVLKLCHYTNLQPLWAVDNMRKGAKLNFLVTKQYDDKPRTEIEISLL